MTIIKLSFTIITLNEEANIADGIQSVQMFSAENVVFDSLDTDGTREIPESLGARVWIHIFMRDSGNLTRELFTSLTGSFPVILAG